MDEWKALDFDTEDAGHEALAPVVPEGLETDAASLQAHFESANNHLADVRQRHAEVLITAGMLPESGLTEAPSRASTCLGRRGHQRADEPRRVDHPLLGTNEEAIQLHVKHTEQATVVGSTLRIRKGRTSCVSFRCPPMQPQRSPQITATVA